MIKSVYTQAASVEQAVADLQQQLEPAQTSLLVVFGSYSYDQQALNSALKEGFPQSQIIGCSSAVEIVSGQMLKNSLVAMAFDQNAFYDMHVEVVENIKQENNTPQAMAAFSEHFKTPVAEMSYKDYVGIVLFDGLQGAEERIMESLGDATNVTFIGASASDNLEFKQTFVYANGQAYSNAVVLALLKPKLGFDFIKTQSFCATDKLLVPTKVNRAERTVEEFNHQPAVEAYAAAVGVSSEQISDKFMSHPVGLMDGDEPFVRSPMQPKGQHLMFYCNVVEDMPLAVLNPLDIVADTQQAVQQKQAELGEIKGIIDFHCILRTLQLQNEDRMQAYGQIFTDIPTVGFSTYGEEFITHVNQTSTMLVFK